MIHKTIICLSIIASLLSNAAHDAPISIIKLIDNNKTTNVSISLDINDLQTYSNYLSDSSNMDQLINYLDSNIEILFNNNSAPIIYNNYKSNNGHYIISGNINQSISSVSEIKINNTCLLNIENQTNIVQLRYDGQIRDFRMGVDRQEIKITP